MGIAFAANQYSTACNSLQEGERYNVITVHVSYVRTRFMCIGSLKAEPTQGLQLFSLYM